MKTISLNEWITFETKDESFEGRVTKVNTSAKGLTTYTVENLMSEKRKVTSKNESIKIKHMQLVNRSNISATITNSKLDEDDVRFIRKYWGKISRKAMAAIFDISTAFAYKTATRRAMFSIPDVNTLEDELVLMIAGHELGLTA